MRRALLLLVAMGLLVTLEWPRSYKAEALRMAREYGV